jgi:hypothetical protein
MEGRGGGEAQGVADQKEHFPKNVSATSFIFAQPLKVTIAQWAKINPIWLPCPSLGRIIRIV